MDKKIENNRISQSMNLNRSKINSSRTTMSGQVEQRGIKSGCSTKLAFLIGIPFIAFGTWFILIGTKTFPVDPKTVQAPYWVLTVAGGVFALAGLFVWSQGGRQILADRRLREAARRHPEEFAFQDYGWDPSGFKPPRWKPAMIAVAGLFFFALFLSMFNWWAFYARGPLMVKIIVSLFDLILIYGVYQTTIRVGRAFKFGGSEIRFLQFPIRREEQIELHWKPAHGIVRANKGSFALRCIEEYWVTTGSGKNRSRHLVHDELWSETMVLGEPHLFSRAEEIKLLFQNPAGIPSTQLNATRPVYWELEVKLDLPGLDFEERYLIPIYESVERTEETSISYAANP